MKKLEAWAVWNIEQNVPCVFTTGDTPDDMETLGAAIWPTENYGARQQALEYLAQFSKETRKDLGIRLKKITISVP